MALPFFNKKNAPKDETGTIVLPEQLPQHVGFIMDGNGRWATKRGMPRKFGHREGAISKICPCIVGILVCEMHLFMFSQQKTGNVHKMK